MRPCRPDRSSESEHDRDRADLHGGLRMRCLPEPLVDGEIPDYEDFLDSRRKLMALEIKTWFEAL